MAVKLNGADTYEQPQVIVKNNGNVVFKLSKEKTPIAYQNKLDELVEENVFQTKEDAEQWLNEAEFELEIYYSKGCGLFAIESGAVESGTVYDPYTGELCEEYKED